MISSILSQVILVITIGVSYGQPPAITEWHISWSTVLLINHIDVNSSPSGIMPVDDTKVNGPHFEVFVYCASICSSVNVAPNLCKTRCVIANIIEKNSAPNNFCLEGDVSLCRESQRN